MAGKGVRSFNGADHRKQDLSIIGLGGRLSYTQTVIDEVIRIIRADPRNKMNIHRSFTGTNVEAIEKINSSSLVVAPMANDIGLIVKDNCVAVDGLLRQGNKMALEGWLSLDVQHLLASLEGGTMENTASFYSHWQPFAQTRNKLIGLGAKEFLEPEEKFGYNTLNLADHDTDLIVCTKEQESIFENTTYKKLQTFNAEGIMYSIFTKTGDMDTSIRIIGTQEALIHVRKEVPPENMRYELFSGPSTTHHLDSGKLRKGQAVLVGPQVIADSQYDYLEAIDDKFGEPNNFTHFGVYSTGINIHGLKEGLKQGWKICTIVFEDIQKELKIREELKKTGVSIRFEKNEKQNHSRELFTGIVEGDMPAQLLRRINNLGGDIRFL